MQETLSIDWRQRTSGTDANSSKHNPKANGRRCGVLRRTQEAAAEARRRRLEAQRLREEAEYLGLFEEVPAANGTGQVVAPTSNQAMPATTTAPAPVTGEAARSIDGDATPQTATDLNAIREELRRRQEIPE